MNDDQFNAAVEGNLQTMLGKQAFDIAMLRARVNVLEQQNAELASQLESKDEHPGTE